MRKERVFEVPSYATAMIANYRKVANVPAQISDANIFNIIQEFELSFLDIEEGKYEALSEILAADF